MNVIEISRERFDDAQTVWERMAFAREEMLKAGTLAQKLVWDSERKRLAAIRRAILNNEPYER